MLRKLRRLLVVFCLLIVMGGCSYDTIFIGSVENSTGTSWTHTYKKFSGQQTKTIKVHEGSPVEVFVDITTESGKLDLTILGKDGTSCYEGKELETVTFSVTIKDPGDYDITVTAKDHKGSFSFTWG